MTATRSSFNRVLAVFIPFAASVLALLAITSLQAQVPTGQACTPGNHPPVANPDTAATNQTTSVRINVLANDTDSDVGNTLRIVSVTQPNKGAATINTDQTITYRPNAGASGVDQFTYIVTDGLGGLASGTVTVTINALVLALGFNELDGPTAFDSSPLHFDGTIREAVRVPSQDRFGTALAFDGVNDVVTVPDRSLLRLTTGMTVEAWVFPTGNTGWTPVVFKERGRPGLSYALQARDGAPLAGGTNKPAGYARINFIDRAVRGTTALPLSAWSHIAMTYDGAVMRFYVDGIVREQRAQTGRIESWPDASLGGIYIGAYAPWNEYFKGLIDDVRIYNVALDANQIQTDMLTPIAFASPVLTP